MGRLGDLTNQKFGRLTVIGRAPNRGKNTMWYCKCECGNISIVNGGHLKNGHTQSCGCYRREVSSAIHKTHGLSDNPLYSVWNTMIQRCYNPNQKSYRIYGAENKSVCNEWRNFEPFYNWAMENGYKHGLTIERINPDGNYEPSNCRWATRKEQGNNTRNNRLIQFNGEVKTMAQWAESKNLTYSALQHRLERNWNIEKALNTPQKNKRK